MSSSPGVPPNSGRKWTWLLVVAIVVALGRLAWTVTHPSPAPVPATTAARAPAAPAGASRSSGAEGTMAWTAIADAERESRASGRPILYDFNAAWCGPCQMLGREVFDHRARASAIAGKVVPVSVVDRYREDGHNAPDVEALQQRFQIEAFPTLVVLSPTTGRFQKFEGYMGADATVDWVARSAASVR